MVVDDQCAKKERLFSLDTHGSRRTQSGEEGIEEGDSLRASLEKRKRQKRMSDPIDIEGTIHTARMQCMRGDREGALKKWEMDCAVSCSYQTVIDSISSVMGRMSPDQQLQAARTMNMYMEEAHAIQEQMARESSAASGVYDMNAAVPVPNEPPRTTPDGLASIGQAFSDIGREVGSMGMDDE